MTERRRFVVSGASGLIGRRLTSFLRGEGVRVDPLVRRPPRPGTTEIRWDPVRGRIDAAALEGAEAVVHLAGESLFGLRWTAAKKRRVYESRVRGTELLARTMGGLDRPPTRFVSASAIGIYGDRGDEPLDESSSPGTGFLADLCRAWEGATAPAAVAGVGVVSLRIGIVLTPAGGALAKMLPAFRLGLGAVMGPGGQSVSWIAPDDLVRIIQRAAVDDRLAGPVNAVAPGVVSQAELAEALGRVLGRPVPFQLPSGAVELLFGQMGVETLLAGARVLPRKLLEVGYEFLHPELEGALRQELD